MRTGIFCEPDEAHVYLFSLSALISSERYQVARSLLSKQENEYLGRIKAPQRHIEYVFGRFILKKILSCYLQIPASSILIQPDKVGKPRLMGKYLMPKLGFNISHSADIFVLSICQQGEIGVDVEVINNRMLPDIDSIAKQHFSSAEQNILIDSCSQTRLDHFFRIWTLKESILKAIGVGFRIPLALINIATPCDYYHINWWNDNKITLIKARHWENLIPGYHIAIARVGELGTLKIFNFGLSRKKL
jgi:4'-phosphopantetheinyl transferase